MKRISLLLTVFLFSCSAERGSDCIERLLIDYPGYEFYVVIPRSLCKSCASTYPSDLMEAYRSQKIALVFNCDKSDTLAIHYHFKGMDTKHLIIDTLSQYTICDSLPESIYPAVGYVKNNMISVEYYNKNNVKAYEKLKKKVLD